MRVFPGVVPLPIMLMIWLTSYMVSVAYPGSINNFRFIFITLEELEGFTGSQLSTQLIRIKRLQLAIPINITCYRAAMPFNWNQACCNKCNEQYSLPDWSIGVFGDQEMRRDVTCPKYIAIYNCMQLACTEVNNQPTKQLLELLSAQLIKHYSLIYSQALLYMQLRY